MTKRTLRIATRKSKMALVQTELCKSLLEQHAPQFNYEIVPMSSDGCYEKYKGELSKIGGKGAFVKALELAMLAKDADLAMHSLKDVPCDEDLPAGLTIPCTLKREDARDAVVCRAGESLAALLPGQKIGTSSVRRAAQLKQSMPHLEIVPLRGNADTRVGKVDNGEVDAAILACSGLKRIGLEARITDVFEPDMMIPAVGQGAVCMECRADDADAMAALAAINHAPTFTVTTAERTLLQHLGGSCHTPIGAYCTLQEDGNLELVGMVSNLTGTQIIRAAATGAADAPAALGKQVADNLLAQGARTILDACDTAA